jgi:hypothetical protein
MTTPLDELVEALLYEGYALYPYTPDAVKNATPTPFGIVYPPAYARVNPAAHDHLRVDCALEAPAGAKLEASVRFLQSSGRAHSAVERRVELPRPGAAAEFAFAGDVRLEGRARLRVEPLGDGLTRVRLCVHNTTPCEPDADRGAALAASLLSTQPIVTTDRGRFLPAAARPDLESVNTWPVLAGDDDRTVLGAAMALPDHPQLAPESRGSLFDGTEIEEALLLHLRTLSDGEREAIGRGDAAVRAMVERAASVTPDELLRLHGRLTLRDPRTGP